MVKHEITIIADYTEETFFTTKELCEICNISSAILNELIEYEIIRPHHEQVGSLTFNLSELTRAKTALRLRNDLDLNFSGVALVLEMMEELKQLREQIQLLEKQFLK